MREIRISIATIALFLLSLGIIMIYSASGVYALQGLGDSAYFLNRHVLSFLIGLVLTSLMMVFDYRHLRIIAKPLILIGILLLVLVLIPGIGRVSFGARRWFSSGAFSFQPSELVKLFTLIYVADFLARKKHEINHFWQGFLPLTMILGVLCVLIIKQPDFGNTVLLASIVLIMMFIAGGNVWHLGLLGILTLPVLYVLVVNIPYRMARILAFLDPWQDSQGVGFQLTQSQIALGSGGIFGVGLGHSAQKLFYLPAAHTDFIFSIIGEELGLMGTMSVIILFILFIWQGMRIIKRIDDPFGYFLSIGIVAMIGLQAVVNIGVSIGALPTKGLPLPLVSYGGSALIFNMMAIGLLLNISRTEDL